MLGGRRQLNLVRRRETTWPVTLFTYYADDAGASSNRLASKIQYPNQVTDYSNYDDYGHALTVTDGNGVPTYYTYTDNLMTSKQIGSGGPMWNYTYDNGELAAIEEPLGNYEVFCHQIGTSPGSCSGGTFSPLLQWKAKADSATGANWSEAVVFTYWPDGTIATEIYEDTANGTETRKVLQLQDDAQGRQTWQGWGLDAGAGSGPAYTAVRSFDPSDNLSGVGLPYNAAPAFCSGGTSTNCELLTSDSANRLSTVQEYPTSSGPAITTQFTHDSNGNVSAVTVGGATASYQYDDFANLLTATLPDTGTSAMGVTQYAYDALGDVLYKVFPTGETVDYSYDQLGRLTQVQEGSTLAYLFQYDFVLELPSGCPSAHTQQANGRVARMEDSFGHTYHFYDNQGHVIQENRLRINGVCSPQDDGVQPDQNPLTIYTYNSNGDLTSITYPHGREVGYSYGSGSLADRISSVNVYTWSGSAWSSNSSAPQISNVAWEPYGGLRAYQVNNTGAKEAVEYLSGSASTELSKSSCPAVNGLGANDESGRLRAVLVSDGGLALGANGGDILKVVYSWNADQVQTRDVCALGTGTPQRETFNPADFVDNKGKPGYDQLLRVEHAEMPNANLNGGCYALRDFGCPNTTSCTTLGYDARGNGIDGINLGVPTYASGFDLDEMVSWAAVLRHWYDYGFTYDADGRVANKAWHADSSGQPAHQLTFSYVLNGYDSAVNAISEVTIANGGAAAINYNYYYDGYNRRRLKNYPVAGVSDEYFYDLGHQMLEDRGSNSTGGSQPYPEDDYVWLGGRPVAYFRGQIHVLFNIWERNADTTSNCSRLGDNLPCGLYPVVTDHIGKPVIALNPAGEIAGLYDYDVTGAVNRHTFLADSAHPYADDDGRANCATDTATIAAFSQKRAAAGLQIDMQTRFHVVDTEGSLTAPVDYAQVRDPTTSTCLDAGANGSPYIGGQRAGAVISNWLPTASGAIDITFYSNSTNNCPDGGACSSDCSSCSACASSCVSGIGYPYSGVSLEGYGYREYQPGATPLALPLRFPGQYYDAETDLNENWNRFYDPSIGRYLEPDPLLTASVRPDLDTDLALQKVQPTIELTPPPGVTPEQISKFFSVPARNAFANPYKTAAVNGEQQLTYGYADDNPIKFSDPNGDSVSGGQFGPVFIGPYGLPMCAPACPTSCALLAGACLAGWNVICAASPNPAPCIQAAAAGCAAAGGKCLAGC